MRLFGMSRLSVAYPKFKFRGFKKMATLPKIVKELISADKVFSTADNNQQSLMFDCVCYALPLDCDLANTHADIKTITLISRKLRLLKWTLIKSILTD